MGLAVHMENGRGRQQEGGTAGVCEDEQAELGRTSYVCTWRSVRGEPPPHGRHNTTTPPHQHIARPHPPSRPRPACWASRLTSAPPPALGLPHLPSAPRPLLPHPHPPPAPPRSSTQAGSAPRAPAGGGSRPSGVGVGRGAGRVCRWHSGVRHASKRFDSRTHAHTLPLVHQLHVLLHLNNHECNTPSRCNCTCLRLHFLINHECNPPPHTHTHRQTHTPPLPLSPSPPCIRCPP